MIRNSLILLLTTVTLTHGRELNLRELFKRSDLVCVAKVSGFKATGRIEWVTFDPKKQPLPATVGGARFKLEACELRLTPQRILKGNAPGAIILKTYRRPTPRKVIVRMDAVDEIDYLADNTSYLCYLKKEANGYIPTTLTRFAFKVNHTPWEKTVVKILTKELAPGKTYTRVEELTGLLQEAMDEPGFVAFLTPMLNAEDQNLRALALAHLMRADRPKILAAAFALMRKVEKKPLLYRGRPTLSVKDDSDRVFWALTSCIERAFTESPEYPAEAFELLNIVLKSTNCRSLVFFKTLDALNEISAAVRGRKALNARAKMCKPALISCLRTRRNSLNAGQEQTILMILSRMDRVTYVGLPEEAGWERKLSASVDRVLKKYPVGWDRKK